MKENDKIIKDLSKTYLPISNILNSFPGTEYRFMPNDEYEKLEEIRDSQLIYNLEIIQRAHFCSVSSLKRILKWITSINSSWNSNNFYGFCASLRGLIEACSDSFYTLSKIIIPIAENFSTIEIALNHNAKVAILAEEIENELIHYMVARKLSNTEKRENPQSHIALQVRDYLNHLKDDNIITLYSELCQISHPSMMSFLPFYLPIDENSFGIYTSDCDYVLCEEMFTKYFESINLTIHMAIIPAIGMLKIISTLDADIISALKIDHKNLEYVDKSEFWKNIENSISISRNAI